MITYLPKYLNFPNTLIIILGFIAFFSRKFGIEIIAIGCVLLYNIIYIHYWNLILDNDNIIYEDTKFHILSFWEGTDFGRYSYTYIEIKTKDKKFKIYKDFCSNYELIKFHLENKSKAEYDKKSVAKLEMDRKIYTNFCYIFYAIIFIMFLYFYFK